MDEHNQETVEITPEIKVIMDELRLPERSIGVGLGKGYEARRINPDGPCVVGNVIWAHASHLDAFSAYLDSEVSGAFDYAKSAASAPEQPTLGGAGESVAQEGMFTKEQVEEAIKAALGKVDRHPQSGLGHESYSRRVNGESWAAIGPHALNNAKAYAKSRSLPWPPSA